MAEIPSNCNSVLCAHVIQILKKEKNRGILDSMPNFHTIEFDETSRRRRVFLKNVSC